MKIKFFFFSILVSTCLLSQDVYWTEISETNLNQFLVRDGKIYGINDLSVFLSLDQGSTFDLIIDGSSTAMTFFRDSLFISFSHCFGDQEGIFYTTDDGVTWVEANQGYDLDAVEYEMCSNDDYIFLATSKGIFRFGDNETQDWEMVHESNYLSGGGAYSIICKDSVIVCGSSNEIFISTDNGNSWDSKSVPITNNIVWEVAIYEDIIFSGTPDGIFISNDLGDTWEHKGPYSRNISSIQQCGDVIFAGTYDENGVMYSQDSGESWANANEGLNLQHLDVKNILFVDDFVLASAGGFMKSNSVDCQINITSSSDANYHSVFNVFPNPTSSNTLVESNLESYNITLYDFHGRRIFTKENANGNYLLRSEYFSSPGMYLIVLSVGYESVPKIILKE